MDMKSTGPKWWGQIVATHMLMEFEGVLLKVYWDCQLLVDVISIRSYHFYHLIISVECARFFN